jgi:hypothetical protein
MASCFVAENAPVFQSRIEAPSTPGGWMALYIDRSADVTYAVNAVGMPTTLLIDAQGRERGRSPAPTPVEEARLPAIGR